MRVLVTRPQPQADDWVRRLRAEGADAQALPLLRIDAADPVPLMAAWGELPHVDLAVFVSPNAVAQFFARRPRGNAWPARTLASAPGPGSAQALADAGVPPSQIVQPADDAAQFDSEALWERLRERDWSGKRVLTLRGDGGREFLADRLRDAGADVRHIQAYARRAARWNDEENALARAVAAAPREHLWLLSSSEALDHLPALAPDLPLAPMRALATHPRIVERARAAGFGEVHAVQPGVPAVLQAVRDLQDRGASLQSAPP